MGLFDNIQLEDKPSKEDLFGDIDLDTSPQELFSTIDLDAVVPSVETVAASATEPTASNIPLLQQAAEGRFGRLPGADIVAGLSPFRHIGEQLRKLPSREEAGQTILLRKALGLPDDPELKQMFLDPEDTSPLDIISHKGKLGEVIEERFLGTPVSIEDIDELGRQPGATIAAEMFREPIKEITNLVGLFQRPSQVIVIPLLNLVVKGFGWPISKLVEVIKKSGIKKADTAIVVMKKVKAKVAREAKVPVRQIDDALNIGKGETKRAETFKGLAKKVEIEDIPIKEKLQSEKGGIRIGKDQPKFEFPDPEIEARFQAAKGIREDTLPEKIKNTFGILKNKATREFEHLPKNKEFAQLRFDLLKLKKAYGISSDTTIRNVNKIRETLDTFEKDLFRRKVILNDLAEVQSSGKLLPFGFTRDTLEEAIRSLDIEMTNHPKVFAAISVRTEIWNNITNDYIKAMEDIGFNVELPNQNYFRHQVLEYAQLKNLYGTGKKLKTPAQRGFLRKRTGSELDINTDYIQAETEVMAQMLYDIEVARTIKQIDKLYNIASKIKGKPIPEGYTKWQPREGDVFYMSDSIPASLAQKLENDTLKQIMLTKEDLRKVLAKGRKFKEFIIKDEIALTLDNLTGHQSSNVFSRASKRILTLWKQWQLLSPRRFAKYNIRNTTGDADAAFVGNPSGFKKLPRAFREIYAAARGKPMTPELKAWFERGGVQSTLQAQEMGELNRMQAFVESVKKKGLVGTAVEKSWKNYWKAVRISTDMRESLLRYANFLDYLEQLKAKGVPKSFGASIPEEIMGLNSLEDKAFWLSNDLLGAYDRVSVLGNNLRDHLYPFWSWKELNFKRYVRFVSNAVREKESMAGIGRKLGAKSAYTAYRVGVFLVKATAFWSMLQAWNYTMFPELEKDLPVEEKNRPHIILGKDKDGKIINFTRIGALGDVLQWFGLDAAPQHLSDWFEGKRSLKEIGIEMAKSPANVIVQGGTPLVKIPAELATRRALFPNLFRPQTIKNRGLHLARSFGLADEYKAIMNLPSRPYRESLSKLFVYKSDPLESAYHDIFAEKNRFLVKIGKARDGFMLSPSGNALYNLKLAIRYEDKEAAETAFMEYLTLKARQGSTEKEIMQGIRSSFKNMHPLSSLTEDDKKAFILVLTPRDREKLGKAIDFYEQVLNK